MHVRKQRGFEEQKMHSVPRTTRQKSVKKSSHGFVNYSSFNLCVSVYQILFCTRQTWYLY